MRLCDYDSEIWSQNIGREEQFNDTSLDESESDESRERPSEQTDKAKYIETISVLVWQK